MIVRTAIPMKTIPATRTLTPMAFRCGKVAPAVATTWTPVRPSAFMATTVQLPSRAVQVNVCFPRPSTLAAQKRADSGFGAVSEPGI